MPEPSVISFDETPNSNLPQLLEKLERHFLSSQTLTNSTTQSMEENNASAGYEQSKNDNAVYIEAFTTSIESALQCTRFALKLDVSSVEFKMEWLEAIRDIVKESSNENLDVIFSLVAALFLMFPGDSDFLSSYLDTLEVILIKNTHLVSLSFYY